MGNGGYVAGLLATRLGGSAEVTLHRPTPLDRPLAVVRDGPAARLMDGDTLLAEARPVTALSGELRRADYAGALTAAANPLVPHAAHPLPHCFVCGPARRPGDGLFIHPGPLPPGLQPALAAPWVPAADLADADGSTAAPFVWAALDCPGGFAVLWGAADGAVLLGRLAVTISRRPHTGEPCAVTAWPTGRDGRKLTAETALFGSDGMPIARARATWILVPREALHSGAR